jgi:hypothetical protein
MKSIRDFMEVKESSVCGLCSKREVCKVKDVPYKELSVSQQVKE